MRYGKVAVYLLTALLAALAVVLWTQEPQVEVLPISLTLSAGGEERTITGWENEAGEYYLFLPSYGKLSEARVQLYAPNVWINGKSVENGMSCEELALGIPHSFSFDTADGQVNTLLTFVQSKDMPALYIDTGSGSMEYVHGKKGNPEPGRMQLYTPDGENAYTGDLDEIKGRGNDWLIPKKSYSLTLSAGADLLGMGQAEKWILQANAFDASHLRNKLVYDFADALGLAYSPESRWVDLYLNGEYAGLYLLCERNELHAQRVSLEGNANYLVSMDVGWRLEENGKPFVTTDSGYAFRIHDSQINDNTLRQLLQSVENAVCTEDGRDPLTGKHWTELLDLDSWVRKYLLEEIFGNSDGGAISQYFYGSAEDGLMYAGPAWDYDVSMGNFQSPRIREPETILAGRPRIWSNNTNPSWYYGLCQQELFYEHMVQIYREICLPLLDTFLNTYLTEYAERIAAASAMNQLRWNSVGAYQVDAAAEAENIRSYMEERIAFLNQLWLEQKPFYKVLIDAGDGGFTLCFAVRPGAQIPFLPEQDASADISGWYVTGSEEAFDITQPVWEDMEIRCKRTEPMAEEEFLREEKRFSVQYVPFAVMMGILGGFCWLEGRRQKTGV